MTQSEQDSLERDFQAIDEEERVDVGLPDKKSPVTAERKKQEDITVAMADQDIFGEQQ